ncbi:MAG: ABC transporter substrate-binding protein, partial [Bilophila wadsworthia]
MEWKPGDYIMLRRTRTFSQGKPHVDRVIIKIIPDMNNRVMAVERGEVDAMPFFDSLREVKRLSGDKNLVVTNKGAPVSAPSTGWPSAHRRSRSTTCGSVRQRPTPSTAIFRQGHHDGPCDAFRHPDHAVQPFYAKDVNMYDVNLEKAKKLLDEAGYPVKADGTRFTVTVDYAPGSPTTKMMAEYLKPQLAKVGIDAKIRISPDFGTWAERVSNYNFDITTDNVFNWGDPVIGVHRTYSSANIVKGVPFSNTQQYRNPKVDAIMEQAASEVDNEKRAKLYKEFQQIVMNDVPIYFMTTTAYHTIYNKRVGNV